MLSLKHLNPIMYIKFILRFIQKIQFKEYGKNFIFDPFSAIITPSLISVGNHVFIGQNSYISAELTLEDFVMIGPNVTIIGGDHTFGEKGKYMRFLKAENHQNNMITIKKDVWIGANVLILKGVEIGEGSIVGAGSVVVKSLPPYVISVGNPCKPMKKVFSDEDLVEHLGLLKMQDKDIVDILERRKNGFN